MAPHHPRRGAEAARVTSGQLRIEDLQAVIEGCLRNIGSGQDWQKLLAAVVPHLRHGFTNAVLIAAQRPGAQLVFGYDEWKEMGRQVNKDEHGIRIIAQGAAGPASVFDLSQTHPARKAAAAVPAAVPAAAPPGRVVEVLTHLARQRGFAVRYEEGAAEAHSDWGARHIVLPPGLPAAWAAAAITHQLTHVILDGHLRRPTGATTAGCRGVKAVEGESAAYLLCARAGLDTSGLSFPSVPSWAGTDPRANAAATIQAVGERIVSAAAAIAAPVEKILAPLPSPVTLEPPAREHAQTRRTTRGQPRGTGDGQATVEAPAADPRVAQLNQAAAAFFRARLEQSWVPGYLDSRGIHQAAQRRWQIGYAPGGWTSLTEHLRGAGHEDAAIEAAGLARRSSRGTLIDVFRDRAMIPIRDHTGLIVAFIGRASPGATPDTPKYLNSPETALYTKGKVLFGLVQAEAALAQGARPVIVEGPMDAIAVSVADAARFAAVAPCGTALTRTQAGLLARAADLSGRGVLIAMDADTAGRKAALAAYHLLHSVTSNVDAAELPAGTDPAEILRAAGPGALTRALHQDVHPLADLAVDAVIAPWSEKLQWAEGQIGALRDVAALIARTPPGNVTRQVVRVGDRLGIPYDEVTREFTEAITRGEPGPKALAAPGAGEDMASSEPRPRTAAQVAAVDWPSPVAGVTARRNRRPVPGAATARPATAGPRCRH